MYLWCSSGWRRGRGEGRATSYMEGRALCEMEVGTTNQISGRIESWRGRVDKVQEIKKYGGCEVWDYSRW